MKGLVMRSTGMWYDVYTEDGKMLACRVRGKLRLAGYKETNPIAVGDFVELEAEKEGAVITQIHERRNHILRQSVKKTGHTHVLAANIDQAILMATMTKPRTSTGFIDRFLVTAEAFEIPQVIFFNKRDLLEPGDETDQQKLVDTYQKIGVRCLQLSVLHDTMDEVRNILHHKTSLIAGHSGVGKSTLLNKLSPDIRQTVSKISDFSEKGTHTTTFAEMFRIDEKTFVIDTPGIKEWGLANMSPEELSDNFPEMRMLRSACKFGYRCLHMNEPNCAVKRAVEQGLISISRYESYLSMLADEDSRR